MTAQVIRGVFDAKPRLAAVEGEYIPFSTATCERIMRDSIDIYCMAKGSDAAVLFLRALIDGVIRREREGKQDGTF
jgi:hypothetical protein